MSDVIPNVADVDANDLDTFEHWLRTAPAKSIYKYAEAIWLDERQRNNSAVLKLPEEVRAMECRRAADLTATALLLGRGLNARLHHRRSQTQRAGYPAIQAIARRCGYKSPTCGNKPLQSRHSVAWLELHPTMLHWLSRKVTPNSGGDFHEGYRFRSRLEPCCGFHRPGICWSTQNRSGLQESGHAMGCDRQEMH